MPRPRPELNVMLPSVPSIVRAGVDEVAKLVGDEVAMYRMPLLFLKEKWLAVARRESERVS